MISPSLGFAKSSGGGARIMLMGGISQQDFEGASASLARIGGALYGAAFFYQSKHMSYGVQYLTGPTAPIKFTLSSDEIGNYVITRTLIQLAIGIGSEKVRAHLLLGVDQSTWTGTPELKSKVASFFHYGLQVTWDVYKKKSFSFPIGVSYLGHPERKYEFENYTGDYVTVKAGAEYAGFVGVALDF